MQWRRYRRVCTTDFLFSIWKRELVTRFILTAHARARAHTVSLSLFRHSLSVSCSAIFLATRIQMKFTRYAYHLTHSVKIKNNLLALTCDRCHFGFVNSKHWQTKLPTNASQQTFIIISHNYDVDGPNQSWPKQKNSSHHSLAVNATGLNGIENAKKKEPSNTSQFTWNGKLIISTLINQIFSVEFNFFLFS